MDNWLGQQLTITTLLKEENVYSSDNDYFGLQYQQSNLANEQNCG